MARKPAKGPGGRPTDYRPEFCDRVETLMAEGFSKMAAAGDCGVSYQTLKNWTEAHPEFLAAVKRGEAKRTMKLERDLLMAETGPQVTSRIFALKNAAPDEWRDRREVDHQSSDGTMSMPSVIQFMPIRPDE